MTKVAVVGMGRMGAAMAGRLAREGHEVSVWNRTRERAEAVAGPIEAAVAETPADAAAGAEVIVSSLADDDACLMVHTGERGTIAGLGDGKVLVETSTVDPGTITALAPSCEEVGAALLDSPVSGSVSLVEQGTLTSMVGGPGEAVEQARPVLEAYSKAIFHLGPHGAGATMKLAVNSLVHATNLAISEALVLAEKAGVDRSQAYEVFSSGAGASPFLLYKREAFENPDDAPVAFSLDLVDKDLELILGLASRVSSRMSQLETTAAVTEQAIGAGMGDRDMSALAVYLRD